jgi:hypothetical protein
MIYAPEWFYLLVFSGLAIVGLLACFQINSSWRNALKARPYAPAPKSPQDMGQDPQSNDPK